MIFLSTSGLCMVCQYSCSHQNTVTAASLSKSRTIESVIQALHSQKVHKNQISGKCVCAFTKIYIKKPRQVTSASIYKYSHIMKNNLSSLYHDTPYKAGMYVQHIEDYQCGLLMLSTHDNINMDKRNG